MKKKDSSEALESYYETIDQLDAPHTLMLDRSQRTIRGLSLEVLKWATACATGIVIAIGFTTSMAVPQPPKEPVGAWGLREQIVQNKMNPEEILGTDKRRSDLQEEPKWRA